MLTPPCRRPLRVAAIALISLAALGSAAGDSAGVIQARASYEVLAEGFQQVSGVAVDSSGAVLVADLAGGTVSRIDRSGRLTTLLARLQDPVGVAVDRADGILILERAGRLLRQQAGSVSVVTSGILNPRGLAMDPDDQIWIATGNSVARLDGDRLEVLAQGFNDVQAIAVDRSYVYVAMKRVDGPTATIVSRVALQHDGDAGEAVTTQLFLATGVAIDAGGTIVVGGTVTNGRTGAIIKSPISGAALFASGLIGTVSVAFAADGDLIAAEQGPPGRVIRFNAPAAPELETPVFTNRSPAVLFGHATPGDLIQVFSSPNAPALAVVAADSPTGIFSVPVTVASNTATGLLVNATGERGAGLLGPSRSITVVHDDHLPRVTIDQPQDEIFSRGIVPIRAIAEDEGSGIRTVRLMLDDDVVATADSSDPAAPLGVEAALDAGLLVEGSHVLSAVATDRAGNTASVAQLALVDRTPPETRIVSGPSGQTAETSVSFVAAADDVQSAGFAFAWRLDEGAWSPFGPGTIQLDDLASGPHRFEVKARDEAGNEDPTPAAQDFTVGAFEVHIVEPSASVVIGGDDVWLRGTVSGGTGEVVVSVSFGAFTLPASVENGMFVAQVPVDPAITLITAVATDSSGASVQAAQVVTFVPDGTSTETLDVWPPGGLAPLSVGLRHGLAGVRIAIDIEGDGVDEFDGIPDTDMFVSTYTRAGVYVPTVRMTTSTGEMLVRRGLVEVYDRQRLDERLQAVWRGFKDSLRSGDIGAAVSFIVAERRPAWTEYFASLPPNAFQEVDRVFTTITLVKVGYGGAEYEMLAERDGVISSFSIWFQSDDDGRWRLWRF